MKNNGGQIYWCEKKIINIKMLVTHVTVAGKSFNGMFTAKIDFSHGYFISPLLMLTLEV